MSLLSVNQLSCHYHKTSVLENLSIELNPSEILCLLGPSGCGKTTLLKAIAGLIDTERGSISLDNTTLLDHQTGVYISAEKRDLGMIFQDYALFPHLSVADNIAFGITHLDNTSRQQVIDEMLNLVDLQGLDDRFPHQLSGGQQQRVAIARALARKPKVLLLDEPFSNIDSQLRMPLIRDIRDILKRSGIAAIFVTHAKDEAFALADTMALLNEGQIVQKGQPQHLYGNPKNRFVADFLGRGSTIPGHYLGDSKVRCVLGDALIEQQQWRDIGHQLSADSPVELFVRPHQFAVTLAEDDASGPCIARVLQLQFHDDGYRAKLEMADLRLDVWIAGHLPVREGVKVKVGLTPQPVVIFQRN
ncbi:ABC transporter ATP-binding protein [Thalassotalea ponticola]|uniref:ABC transporter ATP-binding protein n=1 Tax=Thalassotalea ponticola TaxID=1523392 RepID=UPI0025B2A215|nr:ABC transporter ATP-binding protein [Thalassotalea ponticola]MDN3652012.1 ABC transporter ATP-binding protein [Thalassotalea ponticola]